MAKKLRNQKKRFKKQPRQAVLANLPATKHAEVTAAIELAGKMIDNNQSERAIELISQTLPLEPKNPLLHLTLADAHSRAGNIAEAIKAFHTAFKLAPNYLPAMTNYAIMLYEAGLREKSLSAYRSILMLDADFQPALTGVIQVLDDLRRYEQSIPYHERLIRLRGSNADMISYARALDFANQTNTAIKLCKRAVANGADPAIFETIIAGFLSSGGNKDRAITHFDAAIDHGGSFAHLSLAKIAPNRLNLDEIDAKLAKSKDQSIANVRAPLAFARAVVLEHQQKYDEAFDCYRNANELVSQIVGDDNATRGALAISNREIYTSEYISEIHNTKADQSARPVFVTGLPRSGTTLVERIIASHSQAAGLGELELIPMLAASINNEATTEQILAAAKSYRAAYPNELASTRKIVDKSISSALHLGLILAMFPNAKIIVCERHPMDVAWSAYKEYFNQGALAYTYSFERIAEHQAIYKKNIDHWLSLFGDNIMKITYEDLVNDPVTFSKQLISHVNLEWEDSCLEFYKDQSTIRTASQAQVRQPIHNSSIGKWRRFESHLDELKTILATSVDQYEAR